MNIYQVYAPHGGLNVNWCIADSYETAILSVSKKFNKWGCKISYNRKSEWRAYYLKNERYGFQVFLRRLVGSNKLFEHQSRHFPDCVVE